MNRVMLLAVLLLVLLPGSALAQDPELVCSGEDLTATVDKIAAMMSDAQSAIESGDLVLAVQLLDLTARDAMLADSACRGLSWSGEGEFNDVIEVELAEGTYIIDYEFVGAESQFAFGGNVTVGLTNLVGQRNPLGVWETNEPGEETAGKTRVTVYETGAHLIELDLSGITTWRLSMYKP